MFQSNKVISTVTLALALVVVISGCASSQQKARKEQREKAIQSSRLYCEFINGEQYPDLDVVLNLNMAQRCDARLPFSITDYKTPAEIPGVMFCCSTVQRGNTERARQEKKEVPEKAVEKAPEKSDTEESN